MRQSRSGLDGVFFSTQSFPQSVCPDLFLQRCLWICVERKAFAIFVNRVLGKSLEDGDFERRGEELLAYKNIEADAVEKCDADCFTGVNRRIVGDVISA
jgi:hypothetical protein